MARLVSLLLMLALLTTNGAAFAMAMCQHQDAEAHAVALQSEDAGISAAALTEETAGKTASKKASPGDGAAASLAGFMVPPESPVLAARVIEPADRLLADAADLVGRSVPPLLEPPLA